MAQRIYSSETVTLDTATHVPSIDATLPPGSYKVRQWVIEHTPLASGVRQIVRRWWTVEYPAGGGSVEAEFVRSELPQG